MLVEKALKRCLIYYEINACQTKKIGATDTLKMHIINKCSGPKETALHF